MKKYFKIISVALIITMMSSLMPAQIFAANESTKTEAKVEEKVEQQKPEAKIIGEVEEKREKNVKHFLKDDMTFEAVVYPDAVHYKEDGKWKDIDNSLESKKDEGNNDVLENRANDFKIKIAKKADSDKLVSVKKGKYELSWGMEGVNKSPAEVVNEDTTALDAMSDNDKKKTLTKVASTINFLDVLPKVDLQYILQSKELKEFVVINEKIDNPVFSFNLNAKNLVPELKEDNSIVFYDEKDSTKEVFSMAAPFMYDAKGTRSDDVKVDLEKSGSGYVLTSTPDNEWLNNKDRVYPIKIDPDITISGSSQIRDTYVSSSDPNANFKSEQYIYVQNSSSEKKRIFMSFDLPTLSASDYVTSANFMVHNYDFLSYAATCTSVHQIQNSWDINTLTWNNQPAYDTESEDYQLIAGYNYYTWSITDIVKNWYETGNNHGIAMDNLENSTNWSCILSTEYIYAWLEPSVTITYTNKSGLEDYWTYHSQVAGRAGTGYVNDSTGTLTVIHNDVNTNGNRLPVAISHVFNTSERNNDTGYGYGWKLSHNQTVLSLIIGNEQYYVYTDEDGAKHYFHYFWNVPNGVPTYYIDESGLGRTGL